MCPVERADFSLTGIAIRQGMDRLYNAQARGANFGTTLTQGAPSGNVDGLYVTISAASSSAPIQGISFTHALGRTPIGFDLVQADAPMQVYSNTSSNANATIGYLNALVWGSASANHATVRIW